MAVSIGALAPLSHPGWVEAGEQLLAGMTLAVGDINARGGVGGNPLELAVRDTAASPERAAAAVNDLADLGVAAIGGEYHSVAAQAAAAAANDVGVPFVCSSAVIDALTIKAGDWIARIAPPQSTGWRLYADYLLRSGHRSIRVLAQESTYWSAGGQILAERFSFHGGSVEIVDLAKSSMSRLTRVANSDASALILLVGYPDPAVPLVHSFRSCSDTRNLLIGAPAGQPEFSNWYTQLGRKGAGVPFLRNLPEKRSALASRLDRRLQSRSLGPPSFVAYEGYDTVLSLAEMLRLNGIRRPRSAPDWTVVQVQGTRGLISFRQASGATVWQSACAPVQVAERDLTDPRRFNVLYTGLENGEKATLGC